MLGDLRDWLAGFDGPADARPLAPATDAANRRQLRRGWVDVSYRSDVTPTEALRSIGGLDDRWWERTQLGELHGSDGRFLLRLTEAQRRPPLGLNAVGRVRPDDGTGGSIIEAQMGRSGGDLPVIVLPALTAFVVALVVAQVAAGDGIPFGWVASVPVAAALFVLARLFGSDADDALAHLHRRVPPAAVQPVPLPICTPDPTAAPGEVRRALAAALARPTPFTIVTDLTPLEVRDVLRSRIRTAGLRPLAAPWEGTPLKGRVTPRRVDVFIPRSGSGEQLSSPRLSGSISSTGEGSILHLRRGRSSTAAWAMLVLAAFAAIGMAVCLVRAAVDQDLGGVGTALVFALFGIPFLGAVVATGWRADEMADPVAVVAEAIGGTVLPTAPDPPPLVSPYRR